MILILIKITHSDYVSMYFNIFIHSGKTQYAY